MNDAALNMKSMKLTCIISFFCLFCAVNVKSQDSTGTEICKEWNILPMLYNNNKNDSSRALSWQNYWYYWTDTTKFIPDTLIIDFIVHPFLYSNEFSAGEENDSIFNILATFHFKYGEKEDSYNLINPKESETLIILNNELNFNQIRKKMTCQNNGWLSLGSISLPLIEMLIKNDIFLQDGPIPKGRVYYLNQLVFIVYLSNLDGVIICTYEFIFPINGAYGDGNCCK